ncbi:Lysophospholipase, alpha-beta hydrolase superfamily [Filimonas lacunae]|uniref:Lysophospholipase, alpha-beta hydrolase superfamily n=2 Tax=Filimonas lacunae TaxID=477680 RepID=A0A173MBQ3_9BACT|nr:alpha/beta hydrolase superfamily [Filimonas lacunae]SIT33776.1 Lysophospholipase, alpha-beta hydrolase superfamily [Filimonas lacunae]
MWRKLFKFLLGVGLIGGVLLLAVLLVFDRLVQFRMNDQEIQQWFAQKHVPVRIQYFQKQNREVRYISTGQDTSATVLFIHGAPSSSTYYREYLVDSLLLKEARMFAVDRPGYGYSGLAQPLTSIQQQAAIIRPILDSLQQLHHPVVLVAASYGTAIACRITMDYPKLVDGLVLLGPALAPYQEKTYWFTPMIEHWPFHWAIPRMLQTANAEKIAHPHELEKMLPLWQNIHVPVNYLQGAEDQLVYTTNAAFAREKLVNAPYLNVQLIPNRGHLIAFDEKERISNSILDMLHRVKGR